MDADVVRDFLRIVFWGSIILVAGVVGIIAFVVGRWSAA